MDFRPVFSENAVIQKRNTTPDSPVVLILTLLLTGDFDRAGITRDRAGMTWGSRRDDVVIPPG